MGGREWEELNTDVHAIDDYTMQIPAPYEKQNPPIVCGVYARSLSGAVEAAGVQFLDMASAWPGACRAAHPARRRR